VQQTSTAALHRSEAKWDRMLRHRRDWIEKQQQLPLPEGPDETKVGIVMSDVTLTFIYSGRKEI
jgi:hypothetical protein